MDSILGAGACFGITGAGGLGISFFGMMGCIGICGIGICGDGICGISFFGIGGDGIK
jgi:hypothetical protein